MVYTNIYINQRWKCVVFPSMLFLCFGTNFLQRLRLAFVTLLGKIFNHSQCLAKQRQNNRRFHFLDYDNGNLKFIKRHLMVVNY